MRSRAILLISLCAALGATTSCVGDSPESQVAADASTADVTVDAPVDAGDGGCGDTQSDPNHCGSCTTVCDGDAGGCYQGTCGGRRIVDVSAGRNYACAVTSSGRVWCWGADGRGEIGVDPKDVTTCSDGQPCRAAPAEVAGITDVRSISVGNTIVCAVKTDDTVHCWGSNSGGELGHAPGTVGDRACGPGVCNPTPVAVAGLPAVDRVVATMYGACALTKAGTVFCWGNSQWLSTGQSTNVSKPTQVPGLPSDIVDLAMSLNAPHACAVSKASGQIYCWGANLAGELGHAPNGGSPADVPAPGSPSFAANAVPQSVPSFTGATALSAPQSVTCAIKSGSLYCFGGNSAGNLGRGIAPDNQVRTADKALLPTVIAIDARHSLCAVSDVQEVYCWGSNASGQVGMGIVGGLDAGAGSCSEGACFSTPQRVAGLRATKVSAGFGFVLALTADGKLKGWGRNIYGQAGHPPTTQGDQTCSDGPCNPTPTAVLGLP